MTTDFDVIVLGGGLAGLTLALQLRQTAQAPRVLVLERRAGDAPEAAHKVGESTVELGTHYLREVVGLADELDAKQLPKHGLRFFFATSDKRDIAKRLELGPVERPPVPSHQIDRGSFENELMRRCRSVGVACELAAGVDGVELGKDHHCVDYTSDGTRNRVTARWVVDASGRANLLKRKLNLAKPVEHDINAVWFRVSGEVDVQDWSQDDSWRNHVAPGLRRLGTIHLMDTGYWLWLIPLSCGATSIGIVADPRIHPLDSFNTRDKAMRWIAENEPRCAEALANAGHEWLDFRVLKSLAYHSRKFFSHERWAVTGEAGAFLDPLYSPGTDFIALSNTWISDLIQREMQGEDIRLRAKLYTYVYKTLIANWVSIYQNKYLLMGKPQTMMVKIFWDFATYWVAPVLMFRNHGFTSIELLRTLFASSRGILNRFAQLNQHMQDFLIDWAPHDTEVFGSRYIDPFDARFLRRFHLDLQVPRDPGLLVEHLARNVAVLESVAAEIYRRADVRVNGGDPNALIDPYRFRLDPAARGEPASGGVARDPQIARDVDAFWLYENAAPADGRPTSIDPDNAAQRMQQFAATFQDARQLAEDESELARLAERLDETPAAFRAVAYEGASMTLAVHALRDAGEFSVWQAFADGPGKAHGAQVHVGLGWALASLGRRTFPFLDTLDPLLRWRVFDGFGYFDGLFRRPRTLKRRSAPSFLPEQGAHVYDQGLGRYLWYDTSGDAARMPSMIQEFDDTRRSDLWRGVGLACAYVGGSDDAALAHLWNAAPSYRAQLASGAALAARAQSHSGAPLRDTDRVCQTWFGRSAEETNALTEKLQAAQLGLPAEIYRSWLRDLETALV